MKTKRLFIPFIIWLMVALACSHSNQKSNNLEIDSNSMILSNHTNSYLIKRIQLHDDYFSCYLNYIGKSIEVFSFETDSLIKRYPLHNVYPSNDKLYPFDICFHNFDSIFIVLNKKEIVLMDASSNVQKHWNLDSLTNMDVMLVPSPYCPIIYNNNKLMVGNSSHKYVLNSPESRKKYFQEIIPDLIIDIKKDSVYNSTGVFPDVYSDGKAYYDFYPYRSLGSDDVLIYSFGLDERIYVYNASNRELIGKHKVESEYYSSPTSISDEDVNELSRLGKYQVQQFRYKKVIWDDFHQVYYRVCSISTEPVDDKGQLNKVNNWSLIIMDKSFRRIDEVYFSSDDYYPTIQLYNGKLHILRKASSASKELVFDRITLDKFNYDN